MKNGNYLHVPVMPEEVISGLNIKKNGIYVDGTLGGAGHALGIIEKGGNLIGIDRDRDAIKAASEKLAGGCILVSDNYINIKSILETLIIKKLTEHCLTLVCHRISLTHPGEASVTVLMGRLTCAWIQKVI